ncbi:conserved hypothetical protein [Verrucomicrobia bacterium]|nr:conserved hypothetical protein [Verrucomicrobiota bacterium]
MVLLLLPGFGPWPLLAQIDPVKRDLLQFGYNAPLEGHPPLAAYGFYYRNQPDFIQTNLTLRLALAPVYLDSELGISQALGPHTDLGIGVAGGGFADSYREIDRGTYLPSQSFDGYSGEGSLSVYHLFNPGGRIPLTGLMRGIVHYSAFDRDDDTAPNFRLPENFSTFALRTGLRWGGREPMLFPDLAMELSIWYEGYLRTFAGDYGYGDRRVEPHSHLFWGEALLAYTLPECKHSFFLGLTAGTSIDADRFSAYRLGGQLPLAAEFPLALPGYYFQELSAQRFVLVNANYILPLDKHQRWNLDFTAASAAVDYLPGLGQHGAWNSGVGGGLLYRTSSLKIMAGYAYGVDAVRSSGRGANSIGILMQLDLEKANFLLPADPGVWRGLQDMFNLFGR